MQWFCSRKSLVLSAGDFPFLVVVNVDGSNDLVISDTNVGIATYGELICIRARFFYRTLKRIYALGPVGNG